MKKKLILEGKFTEFGKNDKFILEGKFTEFGKKDRFILEGKFTEFSPASYPGRIYGMYIWDRDRHKWVVDEKFGKENRYTQYYQLKLL